MTSPIALPGAAASTTLAGPGSAARLLDSVAWLVRLRWLAVGVIAAVVTVAGLAASVPAFTALAVTAVIHALANLAFALQARRLDPAMPAARIERVMLTQFAVDLVLLTLVLHWSGGVDNPFVVIYVFHMALAGMLLPMRKAFLVGALAIVLHAGELLLTAGHVIDHEPVLFHANHLHEALHEEGTWRSALFIVAYLSAFIGAQLGVIYFVATVARRQRVAELRRLRHERVARSRQRLARLGTVAGGVAHSVRNPLHGLLNCVDILRKGGADEEILELMDDGVQRIDRVTRRLLALGRDEPIAPVPTDLRLLLDDALRLVRVTARERGITINFEGATSPRAGVDPDRLTEAVLNLLDNAVHASPDDGEVSVRVSATELEAVIEIGDRGPGIPDALRDKVFDPFFTTKPIGEGTGLGLAITRTIVEEHQGEISFEPRAGGGTCVRLTLPLERAS